MTEHPYWLRGITLRNFKSVDEAEVSLGPLTVIVGANSSGKSTLIQAILALCQAFETESAKPEFPLNGRFVRLGSFGEVLNQFYDDQEISIDIGCKILLPSWVVGSPRSSTVGSIGHWDTSLDLTITVEPGVGQYKETSGLASISAVEMVLKHGRYFLGIGASVTVYLNADCTIDSHLPKLDPEIGKRIFPELLSDRVFSRSTSDQDAILLTTCDGIFGIEGQTPMPLDTIVFRNSLPVAVANEYTMLKATYEIVKELLLGQSESTGEGSLGASTQMTNLAHRRIDDDDKFLDLVTILYKLMTEAIVTSTGTVSLTPPGNLLVKIEEINETDRGILFDFVEQVDSDIVIGAIWRLIQQVRASIRARLSGEEIFDASLYSDQNRSNNSDFADGSSELLSDIEKAVRASFDSKLRYLGPLREAPRMLYNRGSLMTDIGISGEYLASVLMSNHYRTVSVPMPDGSIGEYPLGDAVSSWLQKFGLAESVAAKDEGRSGINLRVLPEGFSYDTDLTSLGVGVSQVLPVLVLCLLSEPGTVVILEQPELHLHPKLQQDLADFFLACIESGRQIIIETHSDHLVNRLRYRIAEDETDETQSLVKLLFAEKEDGITTYREPEINEFGGLGDDWPSGFLDLTSKQSQALVRQALLKKKLRASEN